MNFADSPERHHAGTTVVELAVVLLCATVLMAIAVPNLDRLDKEWTLWGASRLLESSLHWGRMHAIAANTSLMFEVDEDGRRFYWTDSESGELYPGSIRYLPGRVSVVSTPQRPLRFYQNGNAAPAGSYTLHGDAGTYRVIVNLAGRIRTERNP